MLEFVSRLGHMAYVLFNNPKGITINRLSQQLQISPNTLNKDLKKLETNLPEGWEIRKDTRKGIYLVSPLESKIEDLWRNLNEQNEHLSLVKVIMETDNCTSSLLMEKFECSRATLYRRIKTIQGWLNEFEITLETTPFYYFDGDERQIRAMMVQFYDIYYSGDLSGSQFLPKFNMNKFKNQLNDILLSQNIFISMEETRRLVLVMHVMHVRANFKRYMPELNKKIRSSGIYFEIANHMFTFFPKYLNNEIMQNEYSFFSLNLYAGSRPKNRQEEIWLIRDFKDQDPRFIWVYTLLEHFSSNFYYDFWNDDQLIYDLSYFITKVQTDSLLLTNTRPNHLAHYALHFEENQIYDMAYKAMEHAESVLSTLDKVSFYQRTNHMLVFLLLQSSIDRLRANTQIDIVIICNTLLEYTVIHSELIQQYSSRLNIRYLEASHIEKLKLSSMLDFVISTVHIVPEEVPHLPVVNIGSLPGEKDYRLISRYIADFTNRKISKVL